MSILVFQHSDSGGPGRLGACLRDHGFRLCVRRPDLASRGDARNSVPDDLDNVHGLIVLGGPQMVTDIDKFPWLGQEAALIKLAHAAGLPIIGICLGAQLIAHTLGGKVDWRSDPAVGFLPTNITIPGQTDTITSGLAWQHPQFYSCSQAVLQTPPGSTTLASAPGTPHAAFKLGLRTFGFQYHFECDRPQLEQLGKETCGQPDGKQVCLPPGELTAQLDVDYARFARISDRLCVNLATYCFPIASRLSA